MAPAGVAGADDDAAAMPYYVPMKATSEGVWQGDNPLRFSLPLVIVQICLVVAVTRGLAFVLRPLRQPRVIAEIIVSSFLIAVRRASRRILTVVELFFLGGLVTVIFRPHFTASSFFCLLIYLFACTI
jgi:Kef-type K+ transport system membrane component KefB